MHTTESELKTLTALISRVSSSLDVDEVLDQAIELCAELTRCEGALVYLWDDEQERLVIRAAVEGYRHWIGAFSLALGEGLTGWTALTRRPGIISEDAIHDPRFKHVPELNDTRFQSVLTVPVVGRDDALVGVLTLHTVAPHEFSDDDVRAAEAVASLIAGAVESARLHEQVVRSMKVFRSLADLSRQLAAAGAAPGTLQRLAATALELLDAACVVLLRYDERRRRLLVETWVGRGGRIRGDSVPAEGRFAQLLGSPPTSVLLDPGDELVASLVAGLESRSLFAAPLELDGRVVGLLACFARERRTLTADNLALLGTIANHAAVALDRHIAGCPAHRALVRDVFDALRAGVARPPAAPGLGLELEKAHIVVAAEASDGRDWSGLARALADVFPGTLTDASSGFAALVPIRSERGERLLEETLNAHLEGAAAGYSERTVGEDGYGLAFRQARIACAISRASGRARGFAGLGAQRHLWTISQERAPDPLERSLARLLELDRRRGTELFRTLETFLERQGNVRRSAELLFVHRNTLRQRLRRIAEIVGVDPTDPDTWFDLQLAVRLIRFRESADG